jgi:hypothetical protein
LEVNEEYFNQRKPSSNNQKDFKIEEESKQDDDT